MVVPSKLKHDNFRVVNDSAIYLKVVDEILPIMPSNKIVTISLIYPPSFSLTPPFGINLSSDNLEMVVKTDHLGVFRLRKS